MSTQDTDQVTVRPATHADCAAIKAIAGNIHDGFDRILYYFHYDVDVETKFSYVAEISGKIVGYASGHVIDDGEAIVMRDGRIVEKHRNNKIMSKLGKSITNAARARFPNLRTRLAMPVHEEAVEKSKKKYPFIKTAIPMPSETFHTHSKTLKSVCESEAFFTLSSKYNIDDIKGFSKREALKLLTEEVRYLDFAPLRPMIGWQPSGWHASTLGNQLQVTDLFLSRHPLTKKIQAFSFLTTIRCDYGVKTGIEFYCDPQAKVQHLTIAHLLHFIRELASYHSYIKVAAFFIYPPEVSPDCVRDVLNVQLGISSNFDTDTSKIQEINIVEQFRLKGKL